MNIYHSKTSQLLAGCKSDSDQIEKLSRLFSVCAGMDEISGCSEDFLSLLRDSGEDALEDDDLLLAAGGIKPIGPPKQ